MKLNLGRPLIQAMPINSDLIEMLTQVIWPLNEQERQLLDGEPKPPRWGQLF